MLNIELVVVEDVQINNMVEGDQLVVEGMKD